VNLTIYKTFESFYKLFLDEKIMTIFYKINSTVIDAAHQPDIATPDQKSVAYLPSLM
jgi:hypothetical protein